MKDSLKISEKFYSIQGEGQTMGVPSIFIRLAGCNLLCKSSSWVCDSIAVWRHGVTTHFKHVLSDIEVERLRNGAHLIFTGGEPLLHQLKIVDYLIYFDKNYGFFPTIEVETNGTVMPSNEMFTYVDYWNCSPKLSNSGEPYEKRVKPKVIEELSLFKDVIFKFVITKDTDVLDITNEYSEHLSMSDVVLMPSGETRDELKETRKIVIDQCLNLGLRYSERLHIVIWNKKTGV